MWWSFDTIADSPYEWVPETVTYGLRVVLLVGGAITIGLCINYALNNSKDRHQRARFGGLFLYALCTTLGVIARWGEDPNLRTILLLGATLVSLYGLSNIWAEPPANESISKTWSRFHGRQR